MRPKMYLLLTARDSRRRESSQGMAKAMAMSTAGFGARRRRYRRGEDSEEWPWIAWP